MLLGLGWLFRKRSAMILPKLKREFNCVEYYRQQSFLLYFILVVITYFLFSFKIAAMNIESVWYRSINRIWAFAKSGSRYNDQKLMFSI
jgi:hypothetical protein